MAMIGFTAKITLPDGIEGAQTAFADSVTVMFPAVEFGETEVTPLTPVTPGDLFRKYLPTLKDGGELTVEAFYNEADYLRVHALNGVPDKTYKVTDPQATSPLVGTIEGFVKKVGEVKFEKDAPATYQFGVRVNKFTTGAS